MESKKKKSIDFSFASYAGLGFLIVLYLIVMRGSLNAYSLQIIVNQTVITAIVATGAIYIYSMGAFDISLGAAVAVSAMSGALVYNMTGSLLVMFLVCVGVAILIELLNSVLAAVFNLPVFVTTIAMLSILNALVKVLIASTGSGQISVPREVVAPLDNLYVKFGFLIGYIGLCAFVFNNTKMGRYCKFIGGNPLCSRLVGINQKVVTVIGFSLAAVGIGIAAFLNVVRAPTLSATTASSVGMDVIIAIIFGGMPVSGGARSKISAALVGSLSMVLLSQILLTLGMDSGMSQLIKSVLFLIVVFLTCVSYRRRILPR